MNRLTLPYPIFLAGLEWHDGDARARKDPSHEILYRQSGVDVAELFVSSELYDTEPQLLTEVDLQSWTFAIRKAYVIDGKRYLFYDEELGLAALMVAKRDSDAPRDQVYFPLLVRRKQNRPAIFEHGSEMSGAEYFDHLLKSLADAG
jgi:hypothetical protein